MPSGRSQSPQKICAMMRPASCMRMNKSDIAWSSGAALFASLRAATRFAELSKETGMLTSTRITITFASFWPALRNR